MTVSKYLSSDHSGDGDGFSCFKASMEGFLIEENWWRNSSK